jgi:two-component system, chemotaxis family, protein-glutamate methylesterase/glutaminase
MAQGKITAGKVVVIGGSAGSLEVLLDIIKYLPYNKAAVYIVIMHRKNDTDSILEDLLSQKTHIPVREVEDKDPIVAGTIYIAPPDYHLLIENEQCFSLDFSEKVHYSRPSIDVTFESVAAVFGERVLGILLSGANADGAKGLSVIKSMGGITLVQDPKTAEMGFMPQQAINRNAADKILDAGLIGEEVKGFVTS